MRVAGEKSEISWLTIPSPFVVDEKEDGPTMVDVYGDSGRNRCKCKHAPSHPNTVSLKPVPVTRVADVCAVVAHPLRRVLGDWIG